MKHPIAAPTLPIIGPYTTAKRAGISTPGLAFPTPHGVGMKDVETIANAYRAAEIDINESLYVAGISSLFLVAFIMT